MLAAKTQAVTGLTSGIETYLFKKHKIDYVKGTAKFASPTKLDVALNEGGDTQVEAKNIIIATGSEVTPFPGIEIDEKQIVSSTGALDLQEVPKKVSPFSSTLICMTSLLSDLNRTDDRHRRWCHWTGAWFRLVSTGCRGPSC